MELTDTEQKQIKDWILSVAESDRTVILKMQDESVQSQAARSCIGDYGHGLTLKQNIRGYKLYAADHGIGFQSLFPIIESGKFIGQGVIGRGGMSQSEIDDIIEDIKTKGWRTPEQKVYYWGALIEARVGFETLNKGEYAALIRDTDKDLDALPYDKKYAQIQKSRPLELLQKCSYEEFMQLRQQALQEAGLWLGKPAPPQATPAPATSAVKVTAAEQQEIAQWILQSTDESVVRKMQDESVNSRLAPSCLSRNGATLAQNVEVAKCYVSGIGNLETGFFTTLSRGGFRYDRIEGFRQSAQHSPARSLYRALLEAQTGFCTLAPDEFTALKNPPSPLPSLQTTDASKDKYRHIFTTKPRALSKITFDEFMAIRQTTLQEIGWLPRTPAPAPAPSFMSQAPAPKANDSWVNTINPLTTDELLHQLGNGITLVQTLHQNGDHESVKTTLTHLQQLHQQLATSLGRSKS